MKTISLKQLKSTFPTFDARTTGGTLERTTNNALTIAEKDITNLGEYPVNCEYAIVSYPVFNARNCPSNGAMWSREHTSPEQVYGAIITKSGEVLHIVE